MDERFADIIDPDVYVHGAPHATFRRLLDEDPVSWREEKHGSGFWAIPRYDDILAASHHTRVF
jgi:hypothetical protein